MTTSIQDFVSHIKRFGIAKTNRFRVTFNLPRDLQMKFGSGSMNSLLDSVNPTNMLSGLNNSSKVLSLMCQQVTIPGYTTTFQEQNYGSTNRKLPVDKSTGEFDMTFYGSGDMMEKKIFDAWKDLIFRPDHTIKFYDDIVVDILVEHLNDNDEVVYQVKITEAYPCTVNPIVLDRSSTNTALIFQVSFNYRKVKENGGEDFINSGTQLYDDPRFGVADTLSTLSSFLMPSPNIGGGASQRDINMYKSLNNVKTEIEYGMNTPSAIKLIKNITVDCKNNGGSPDVLSYANTLLMSLGR